LALRDQALAIVPASLPARRLEAIFKDVDRAVVVRIGRNLGKVRQALLACRMAKGAILVEGAGPEARSRSLEEAGEGPVPPNTVLLAAREAPSAGERG
jgi:precorrin-2/cobalt-factor-2 C20-methyltransferase